MMSAKSINPRCAAEGARITPAMSRAPESAVSVTLLSLEMKRVVRQLPGKLFVRNR